MFSHTPAAPIRHTTPARALLRGDEVVLRKGGMPHRVADLTKGAAAVYVKFEDGTTAVFMRQDRVALVN